jgi:hypothetical protein
MARSKAPDPLKRRHLVEETLAAPRALAIAESYLAEGRVFDAMAFLAKAGENDRLRALLREAVAAGDVFLAREISGVLGEPLDADAWSHVARAAASSGKERYASEAERLAAARTGERARAR